LSAAKVVQRGAAAKKERKERRETVSRVCIVDRRYHKTAKMVSRHLRTTLSERHRNPYRCAASETRDRI
jgi:hypothetical protein